MLVDEQGRLFGRVNLIDLAVGLLVLVLIPLGYGAYVLFRTPTPRITSVEPATLVQAENSRITIRGTNLRPYLRARIGPSIAPIYLAESPSAAEITFPKLPPGVYDLALYDEAQEVVRLPGALTISVPPLAPPPPVASAGTVVQMIGEFPSLSTEQAKQVAVGARLQVGSPPVMAQVLAVRSPAAAVVRIKTASGLIERPVRNRVRVAAVLRAECAVVEDECKVGGTTVAANATIPWPIGGEPSMFRIDRVDAPSESAAFPAEVARRVATVTVRFWVFPEAESLITAGATDADRLLIGVGARRPAAQLLSFRKTGEVDSQTGVDATGSDPRGAPQMFSVTQRLAVIEAALAVPVERALDGWEYKGVTLRLGAPFSFEGGAYTMRGRILRVNVTDEPARPGGARPKGTTP